VTPTPISSATATASLRTAEPSGCQCCGVERPLPVATSTATCWLARNGVARRTSSFTFAVVAIVNVGTVLFCCFGLDRTGSK
jgi:hypothetical protein